MSDTSPTPDQVDDAKPKGNIRVYCGKQYDITDPRFKGLSKNAIKKILKDEIWEETKSVRNKEKRDRFKKRRVERRKLEDEGVIERLPKRPKAKHMKVGEVGVILDCSFSSYMNEKEISSLRQQIVRCYSANVRAQNESMKMALTSLDEPLKKQLDAKAPCWNNWKNIDITSEPYINKFNKEDIIYLSADSDNIIHELENGKHYIIGGIVDKNRYKNLCNDKAKEQGIKTGQLPIGDYIHMTSRKVLTVNQVMEIMVKWLDYRDWEKAFMEVIPERKLKDSTLVNQDETDEDEEDNDDDDVAEEAAEEAVEEEKQATEASAENEQTDK